MKLKLVRTGEAEHNFGRLVIEELFTCDTLEDKDRRLENGGIKVPGETAIPRGKYPVIVNRSMRFGKDLPLLIGVPKFEGVRIHGGVDEWDTEGCILVGVRNGDRLANALQTSRWVTKLLTFAQAKREMIELEVI